MKRRDSLKALALGAMSASLLVEACKTTDKKTADAAGASTGIDRMREEAEYEAKLMQETFFTPHEMATITMLADIIIPKDDISGSASEAKVPEFIEFIVKDKPEHQTPMRGGLRWMDMQQGVAFFSLMRNLTATGFYTSEMGVKDIGYQGNTPNRWDGVPDDVQKQYGLAYTEKELKECVKFDEK
jgi:gluconate 2-dehydrogenase gamma chain